ncbi:MAG TPA: DUF1295 domain-containing protein [Candidatus Paceibacterota bacterium]|nr:DUF1295 domain-containing protein [Candidatus Paceibacterota bacterium]
MEYIFALLISILINITFFVPAFIFKTDKLTDMSYGLSFLLISILLFYRSGMTALEIIFILPIILWSIRIISYLLIRILKTKKDARFDGIREYFWKFFGFWILQAISVWIIMLPAIHFLNVEKIATNYYLLFVGLIISIIGLIIESVSDWQKFKFKNNPQNTGRWIEAGLWKYSQHPNYFGEIQFWIGIYIASLSVISNFSYLIGIISPIYVFFILRFVSGIPPLEKRMNEKYSNNATYQEYKKTTNILLIGPKNNPRESY